MTGGRAKAWSISLSATGLGIISFSSSHSRDEAPGGEENRKRAFVCVPLDSGDAARLILDTVGQPIPLGDA